MKKKLLIFIMSLGMALGFCACDSSGEKDEKDEKIESLEKELHELKKELKNEQEELKEEPTVTFPDRSEVFIPSGNMTDSLEDYENMNPASYEWCKYSYWYKNLPVVISLPKGEDMWCNDICYTKYEENYVFTYDISGDYEYEDLVYELVDDFTQMINAKADVKNTVLNCINEEDGYINGCGGLCHTFEIKVDGESEIYYATIYELITYEDFGNGLPVIVIGCFGKGCDEVSMQKRYDFATEMVRTLMINERKRENEYSK